MADPENVLGPSFAELAAARYGGRTVADTYDTVCHLAVRLIDGCDHAGVTELRPDRTLHTLAASDDVAARVDRLESEVEEGPRLDAMLDEAWQHDPDSTSTASCATSRTRWSAGTRTGAAERSVASGQPPGASSSAVRSDARSSAPTPRSPR